MAKISLTEKERIFIRARLNPIPLPNTLDRRKMDRLFTALALDDAPDDSTRTDSLKPGAAEYPLTSDERDALIAHLEPTDRQPMQTIMSRVLGPIYDTLIRARDGAQAVPPALASVAEETA